LSPATPGACCHPPLPAAAQQEPAAPRGNCGAAGWRGRGDEGQDGMSQQGPQLPQGSEFHSLSADGPRSPGRPLKALEHGVASLSLHDDGRATLQLQEEAWCSTFDLFKLPFTEARTQLQALMFGLVGCVKNLEKRLEGLCVHLLPSSFSLSLTEADPNSRKNRGAGSTLPAKRRGLGCMDFLLYGCMGAGYVASG
uniref:Uncharacterized protein n=1 Tax=Apteryx owenii TaxID=8824 RepID=A0A8B9NXW4_APTOW